MTNTEVRNLRKRHRLTQEELAGVVYVSTRSVRSWESGARNISQAIWELMLYKLDGVEPTPYKWVSENQGKLI